MAARISSIALAHRWLAPLAAVLLAAVSSPLWLGAPGALGVGPLDSGGAQAPDLTITLEAGTATSARVATVARAATRSQLESDPGVASVQTSRQAGAPRLNIDLDNNSPGSRLDAITAIPSRIDAGPLRVEVGGAESTLQATQRDLGGDLWRIGLVCLPFAMLALTGLAGWRWAASVLVAATLAVMLAVALVRAADSLIDLSSLALAVAGGVGVATAVEVAFLVAFRASDLPTEAVGADRIEGGLAQGERDGVLWAASVAVVGVVAILSRFEQASALGLGAIAGAVGGLVAGLTLSVAALTLGAALPRSRFEAARSLAGRLAGNPTGWTPPGLRRFTRVIDVFWLVLLAIALGAASVATYLLSDTISNAFGAEPPPGLGTAAIACAIAVAVAVVAARTVVGVRVYRESAALGAGPPEAAAEVIDATMAGALASTVLLGLFGGLLLVSDVGAAGEFGVVVAAILLVDVLIGRIASAACWARLR